MAELLENTAFVETAAVLGRRKKSTETGTENSTDTAVLSQQNRAIEKEKKKKKRGKESNMPHQPHLIYQQA